MNYSFPIYGTLSFVGNTSILYLVSKIESSPISLMGSNLKTSGITTSSGSYNSLGVNIALGLSYYIDSLNNAINLSGRYQVLYNMYSSGNYSGSDK